MSWRTEALCAQVDPELWFPDKGDAVSAQLARAICQQCPVRAECLAEALENNFGYGIWGGLSIKERQRHRKNSKEEATA
jgi:WhiB family redox-sensing transcriptional regulator